MQKQEIKQIQHGRDHLISFHEIRSLSARLYTDKMSSDFAQKLLGHKSANMTLQHIKTKGIKAGMRYVYSE
ncbi:MAG TPA: tyrosine-type recombinase/integrase [Arsenophonus sp.]